MIFVVSWTVGNNYVNTPCVGKEPEGIVCAKAVEQRREEVFKTNEAAQDFVKVMQDMKATGVRVEKRDK